MLVSHMLLSNPLSTFYVGCICFMHLTGSLIVLVLSSWLLQNVRSVSSIAWLRLEGIESMWRLCHGSRGKSHQAFSICFCALYVIKNWTWGRPENKANDTLNKWKEGSGQQAGVEVYTLPRMQAHFHGLLICHNSILVYDCWKLVLDHLYKHLWETFWRLRWLWSCCSGSSPGIEKSTGDIKLISNNYCLTFHSSTPNLLTRPLFSVFRRSGSKTS